MESEAVDFAFGQGIDIVFRVGHHQVTVEVSFWQFLAETGYNRRPKRKIINEMAWLLQRYPSIMSMCKESAPHSRTFWQSAYRLAKSAERIDGAITDFNFCIWILCIWII